MSNLSRQRIIKYLSVALIVAIILYVLPSETPLETNYIVLVSFSAAIFSFVLDVLVGWYRSRGQKRMEGMVEIEQIPKKYIFNTQEQDYANTGLEYDNDLPGYYLINNGKFSEGTIPYSEADDLIIESKLHDLYNQQNFNIVTSPHTHLGKGRGHLNWEPVYD